MTGIIKGFEVRTNRNSDQKVLMLQVEISGPDDIQSVEWYNPGGVQSVPLKESIVQILQNGKGWKVAVSANDNIDFDESLNEGDKKIYSLDSNGAIKSSYVLNSNGEHIFNDGSIEAARNGDAVRVTIPTGTFIVSVSGGSGSPAVGVLNPAPIDVDGTIQEGTNEVIFP